MHWKKLGVTALTAFIIACCAAFGLRAAHQARFPAPPQNEQLPDAVVVFCFHGAKRSAGDRKIEEYSYGVLARWFGKQLRDGDIVWRVLDYESPENVHFRKCYQVSDSCIVLVDARPDRPGVAKNLQQSVNKLASDKGQFQTYLRDEIKNFLK